MPPRKKKIDGLHISGTRMQLHNLCQRKWAAQYVMYWDGGPPKQLPPSDNMQFGTDMHLIAEEWLRDATIPPDTPEGRTFKAGMAHWPAPKTKGLYVERSFVTKINGRKVPGTMDVLWVRADGSVLVGDHKTTAALFWAKSPQDLLRDEQAMLYAHAAFEEFPEVDEITMRWVYYVRLDEPEKEPASKKVEFTVSRSHVESFFGKTLAPTAKNMLELYDKKVSPVDVPPSYDACDAYGGCPYKSRCKEIDPEREERMQEKLDSLAKLAKRGAAKTEVNEMVRESVKEEEPKLVEPKTKGVRASKKAHTKEAIAALIAVRQSYEQHFEMLSKIYETQSTILDRLLEDL